MGSAPQSPSHLLELVAKGSHERSEAYYNNIARSWRQVLGASFAALYLLAEETGSFVLAGADPVRGPWQTPRSVRAGEAGLGERALHDGVSVWKDAAPNTENLLAPLTVPGAGAVGLLHAQRDEPFTEADRSAAAALCQSVGAGLNHARLLTKLAAVLAAEKEQAKRTQAILSNLTIGVVTLDAHGRVREMNASAKALLGIGEKERIGTWETVASSLSDAARSALTGSVLSALNGVRRTDELLGAGDAPCLVDAIPFSGGAILLIENLGPRLEQERELARVRRLAEIGQMTAAIAHELRNPLTSIRGAAQMMRHEDSLARAREWAAVVEEEADGLERLCQQFLDFARPVEVVPEPIDLNDLVERALRLDGHILERAAVRVNFKAGRRKPTIQGDPVRLTQVLRNLLRNAVEAMPDGGTLTIETAKSGRGVRLSVHDTGIGITEEQMASLFTPFYTTKPHGTGLGLCNVRKVVEAHNGTIRVRSKPGKGTEFRVILPAKGAGA
jgi:signal transduction histidine kinase